ncbi:MAG: GH3 family domain-containing protein [Candidatus Helarchaeota archaeon]
MKFLNYLGFMTGKYFLKYFEKEKSAPITIQIKLLNKIIHHNSSTVFGKKHHFDNIRNVKDFQNNCKIIDYSYLKPYIQQTINGNKSALTNSKILYWGQTSGTTGKPKLIPITKHVIDTYNSMSFRIIFHFIKEHPERSKFLNGKWFLLPSFPLLRYEKDGRPVGFITGIIIHPFGIYSWKKFLKPFYYYPIQYLGIKDPNIRFKKIAEDIKGKNITYAMGVTSVLINFLEKLVEYYDADNLLEILPNYQFTLFSGGSTRRYIERFYKIVGKKVDVREGYFATEGSFAIQKSDRPVMEFVYDSCFYEFVPVSNKSKETERLLINQLKKNGQYKLIITCYNGLYAYDMNDIIKITSIDPVEFQFLYREGVIDLADEKLTPNEVNSAINYASIKNNCEFIDYCMFGIYDPRPHYIFLIEFKENREPKDFKIFLNDINLKLQELNEIYFFNIAGPNKGALTSPELWVLNQGAFIKVNERKLIDDRNIGQSKINRFSTNKKDLNYFEDLIKSKFFINEI